MVAEVFMIEDTTALPTEGDALMLNGTRQASDAVCMVDQRGLSRPCILCANVDEDLDEEAGRTKLGVEVKSSVPYINMIGEWLP